MDPLPDKEQPDKKPPSRGASGESAEDRRFWGEEDEESDAPAKESVRDVAGETEESSSPASGPEDSLDDDLDEPPAATSPESERRSATPPPGGRGISRLEVFWMCLLGVVLLVIAVLAFKGFLKNVQTVGRPEDVDFPVKGNQIVIGDISTWWRRPDPDTDRVQLGTHLLPCATIVLKSGTGAVRLRCFFEDDAGDYVGDPVTLEVMDGRFQQSGEPEATINATGGLKGEGEYNAYASTDVDFWYLKVLEGPPGAAGDEFQEIVRVPVSPKRR